MTVKTSVYLREDQKAALAALAARTGTSEADLLRQGVDLVVAAAGRPKPRAGLGRSTDGSCAANADADLARLGFGT